MRNLVLITAFLCASFSWGQNEIQSSPENVMNELFRSANERDFRNLHLLCPPSGINDGDTQEYICDINGSNEKEQDFIDYFKNGYLNGEITYQQDEEGRQAAHVPFWFNHPGGESRSNETMNLMKIEGKWYLISF